MTTVFVTGANRGIGLALVKHYVAKHCTVYATSRSDYAACPELAALIPQSNHVKLDVADAASVAALKSSFKQPISILINNAGILVRDSFASAKPEDVLEQFKVNAMGPLFVTQALAASLSSGSKVINNSAVSTYTNAILLTRMQDSR